MSHVRPTFYEQRKGERRRSVCQRCFGHTWVGVRVNHADGRTSQDATTCPVCEGRGWQPNVKLLDVQAGETEYLSWMHRVYLDLMPGVNAPCPLCGEREPHFHFHPF